MRDIPGTEYIHKMPTGHYQITRKMNYRTVSFGTYKTLVQALVARDWFESINWNPTFRLHLSKSNHIEKLPSGRYEVCRQPMTETGQTKVSYGTFDTIEEARHQVLLCKTFGWDLRLKPFDCMRYIEKRIRPTGTVTYRIVRRGEYFGTFETLEDAQFERDWLVMFGWDLERVCELADETFGGDRFLNGKYCKGNQIYRAQNGRIDYGTI